MSVIEDRGLHKIAAAGAVDPYDPAMVNPSSIDLRLGREFRVQRAHRRPYVDLLAVPNADEISELVKVAMADEVPLANEMPEFTIHPGEFILASTLERLHIPDDVCMVVDGKSSVGRLGLAVHVTAGFFDPGFQGIGTLEMVNLSPVPIILRPGLRICQSRWMRMENVPAKVYDGRYQGAVSVDGSRYGQERP